MKALLALTALLLITACVAEAPRLYTFEEERYAAELFILNGPTYAFDGNDLQPVSEEATLRGATFTYSFTSSHAGYGDRQGRALAEVESPHFIVVTVEEGSVISAVIDGEWDELTATRLARP